MRRALTLFCLALLLALASPATAQQVTATVTMRGPGHVEVGQAFQLEVRADVTGDANAHVELPDLSPFDVMARQVSNPVQFRFGFGTQTQVVQSTTVHRLTLRARESGTYELTPAAVVAQGRRFESNALTIEVGSGGPLTQVDPGATSEPPPPAGPGVDGATFASDGFVRTFVDRAQPYVGQQLTATVYLYSPSPVQGNLAITLEPTTDGFWVHDLLPASRSLEGQMQVVRGERFYVYVLRRFAAFPLRSGELTIGPTGVSLSGGGFFGSIFGAPSAAPMSRTGVPVTIQVRDLPTEHRPAGEVHVGTLELAAELDRSQVATGDAVTLTVTARGVGQMQQVSIAGPSNDGLQVLQPQIDDQISSPRDVVGGSRRFQWLVVPQRAGTFELGPFEVPVFDPESATYSVARSPALRLVAAGNPVASTDDAEPDDEAPTEAAAEEPTLAPIHTRSELSRTQSRLVESPAVAWSFALGPLALLGAIGVRIARRRANDASGRAPQKAQREAKRRLGAAAKHADANQPREFYAAIAAALKEVLEAKLERAVGSLTHAELRRTLIERGMAEGLADRVVDELEGCDFARFSAAGVRAEEMRSCLERTRGILGELDRFTPRAAEVDA